MSGTPWQAFVALLQQGQKEHDAGNFNTALVTYEKCLALASYLLDPAKQHTAEAATCGSIGNALLGKH